MTPITDVSIELVTNEEYITTVGGGGIQIRIDGERLNRYVDESSYEWSNWHPEYAGDDVASDLWRLISTTTTVLEERAAFDETFVDFSEFRSGLVLEYLGSDAVRVAFRVAEPKNDAEDVLRAVPESACGYPIDASAWGNAVFEAGQTLREELEALGHETPGDEHGFDPLLDDLRAQLD